MPPGRRYKKTASRGKASDSASPKTDSASGGVAATSGTKRKADAIQAAAAAAAESITIGSVTDGLLSVAFVADPFDEKAFAKFPVYHELKKKARVKNADKQTVARLFIDVNPQAVFEEEVRNTQLCRSLFEFLMDFRVATDTRIKRAWKATITAAVLASLYALEEQNKQIVKNKTSPLQRGQSAAQAFQALDSVIQASKTAPNYDWQSLLLPGGGVNLSSLPLRGPVAASTFSPPASDKSGAPCCEKNEKYLQRIKNGERPKGRPPHSDDCKAFVQQKIQALFKL